MYGATRRLAGLARNEGVRGSSPRVGLIAGLGFRLPAVAPRGAVCTGCVPPRHGHVSGQPRVSLLARAYRSAKTCALTVALS